MLSQLLWFRPGVKIVLNSFVLSPCPYSLPVSIVGSTVE